jgi:hypothetical protein
LTTKNGGFSARAVCEKEGKIAAQDAQLKSGMLVSSVLPAVGSAAGGTDVRIYGVGFTAGQAYEVSFGDAQDLVMAVAVDERQLTATTPSGDASVPADVLVTAPDGKQAVALRAYTFDGSMPLGNFVDCPGLAKAFKHLRVFLCKSVLYGVFVWARRALNR